MNPIIKIKKNIYDFILEDPLFSSLVPIRRALLKGCMDADIARILRPSMKCPNMTYLLECAQIIMKLKKMQNNPHNYFLFQYLEILRELSKIEYIDIIDNLSLRRWCEDNLSQRFQAPPGHFYGYFIEIMNDLDERQRALYEEARERGRALYEEHRQQGEAIVQAEKERAEEANRAILEDWGLGGKGKRKRTQRGRSQQRKLKHKRYSSRYKRKSKSRR